MRCITRGRGQGQAPQTPSEHPQRWDPKGSKCWVSPNIWPREWQLSSTPTEGEFRRIPPLLFLWVFLKPLKLLQKEY